IDRQPLGGGASRLAFRVILAGAEVEVDLHASDVRAAGYQLLERTAAGLRPVAAGPCTTFRGGILGDGSSRIAASLVNGIVRAVILRGDDMWVMQPLCDVVPGASGSFGASYVVFRGSDCLGGAGHCGVAAFSSTPLHTGCPDSSYECELALEVDHALFLLNN